jgi:hypothetical protein
MLLGAVIRSLRTLGEDTERISRCGRIHHLTNALSCRCPVHAADERSPSLGQLAEDGDAVVTIDGPESTRIHVLVEPSTRALLVSVVPES